MSAPLFCPFCGESFEGRSTCPEHDIPLVDFEELQRTRAVAPPNEHEALPAHSLALGRGFVAVGALLFLTGFFLPFARAAGVETTGFALASGMALSLWTTPLVGLGMLSVLVRRRTPAQMRGARLAVAILALGAAASAAVAVWRVHLGAQRLREMGASAGDLDVLIGPWLIAVGVLCSLVGAARLGRVAGRGPSYRV